VPVGWGVTKCQGEVVFYKEVLFYMAMFKYIPFEIMKITNFHIQGYRAIADTKFPLLYSINPIIGINESGKTSILKAILAFDKKRDRFHNGEHLNFSNKYSLAQEQECNITISCTLDKGEIERLIKSVNLKTGHDDYSYISSIDTNTIFSLSRNFAANEKKYVLINDSLSRTTSNKLCKYLVNCIPYILYFDDFTDRVPEEVTFPEEYTETQKIPSSRQREWQEIVEEIFRRAGDTSNSQSNPLVDFLLNSDEDYKDDYLSDIVDLLNTEIIEEWKKVKKRNKAFSDDSDNLELIIKHADNKFHFKIKDRSYHDKRRTFDIVERSKGFQWYFNYMMKLKFNPNYKESFKNSIFLLDEPGSYLHSSAQKELLKELERVSKHNTIIYCTHSQHLLNPNIIKLGSIKIAERNNSVVNISSYGSYTGRKDKSALSPLYDALDINIMNEFEGRIVITEGITDYYLYEMIKSNTNMIDKNIRFIPGHGADQSSTLISLAISYSDGFLVILDNDEGGKKGEKHYKKVFGDEISNHIYKYYDNSGMFCLENLLSNSDVDRLKAITKSSDIKRGLGFLFYDYKNKQSTFFESIEEETIKLLSEPLDRINHI
jgi:predicted ATP-dependent endonuclease of OLD family